MTLVEKDALRMSGLVKEHSLPRCVLGLEHLTEDTEVKALLLKAQMDKTKIAVRIGLNRTTTALTRVNMKVVEEVLPLSKLGSSKLK